MDSILRGRKVLLIISGGIAAYKVLDLIRRLREQGCGVTAVMTRAAEEFVTPMSVAALTGNKVYQDLFSLTDEAEMGHIELSRSADLLVVAPARADLMARMAHGLANDLATTTLLATDTPVLLAPAMNVRMWSHPATQRNIATLKGDGIRFVGPNAGTMACGELGPGRMAEPQEILTAIEANFQSRTGFTPLAGKRALVTSGPTHEPIDPVRYIANRSSGKQGHAIAGALARLGAQVTLVSGPVHEPDPHGVTVVKVETAKQMLAESLKALPCDIAVCAAAVADWHVAETGSKIKKDGSGKPPALILSENPDILHTLSNRDGDRPALVVGFAAETDKVIEHATDKRKRKGCDWIVANDVSPGTGIMGGDMNRIHLITDGAREDWEAMAKTEVAAALAARIAKQFEAHS